MNLLSDYGLRSMKLQRTTVAQLFKINTPVWGGRKVGLAIHKLGQHNEVQILYKDSNGERVYPQPFYISREQALGYPTQPVKKHPYIILAVIPINDMEILERE